MPEQNPLQPKASVKRNADKTWDAHLAFGGTVYVVAYGCESRAVAYAEAQQHLGKLAAQLRKAGLAQVAPYPRVVK